MNHKILWKDAQDMLYEEPIFKEDTNLQNMDKEDALGTFDSFKRLEIVFEIPSEDGRRIALAVWHPRAKTELVNFFWGEHVSTYNNIITNE